MEYSSEKLKEITAVAEKYGTFEAVAKSLNITSRGLLYCRKRDKELEKAIQEGLSKHISKKECPYTESELNKIERIMQTGYKKDVAKYFNVCVKTITRRCKKHLELKIAILKGRKARYYLQYDVVKHNLPQIEKVAESTGQRTLIAKFLNIDMGKLKRTERVYPFLALAVQRGLAKYKANKKDEKLSGNKSVATEAQEKSKPIELFKFKKPARELVARLDTIEDISEENALARYRRMKEEEKKASIHKQVKNISEII